MRLLILVFIFASHISVAQYAKIEGLIIDHLGEPLIGVNIIIKNQSNFYGTSSDIDGRFTIDNITPGSYTFTTSYIGFNPTDESITFTGGKTINKTIKLNESTSLLQGATVSTERAYNTERALVLATKDAKEVVSGISMQQIQKSQDGNAAQVMQRVHGVTVVSNRFIMIRGISERYNSVMINNVIAPSTEVDKRTFSFDLLSSGSLDRMLVFKSGAPDMPGDFAGGVIKITTKSDIQ